MSAIKIGASNLSLKVKNLTITPEKIWSSKTGRTANGEMMGDIVAIKWTLNAVLCPMTDEQAAAFDKVVAQAYFNVTFRCPTTGKDETHVMYAGSPSYPVYSYVNGLPRYVGVAVNFIEK